LFCVIVKKWSSFHRQWDEWDVYVMMVKWVSIYNMLQIGQDS